MPHENHTQHIQDRLWPLQFPFDMDVHDRVTSFREDPLQEGMVIVVDPMVWLPDDMQYIRTEDTIVVGKDGVEVLTALAPYRMDEIEALMAQPSAFDALP